MNFLHGKIRWTAFIVLFLALSCSKKITKHKFVTPNLDTHPSVTSEESYQVLKSKWTVRLNALKQGGPPSPFFSGPSESKGLGSGGEFPLMVTASLMDINVIEAGLIYYANILAMSPIDADSFKNNYYRFHDLENKILIEATLQTSWAENYLNLDRWTIFLEDDQGIQCEPVKIIEPLIPLLVENNRLIEQFSSRSISSPHYYFEIHKKQLFLYFPRFDHYGHPIIHKDLKFLKIVFLLEDGEKTRAEGVWMFDWLKE